MHIPENSSDEELILLVDNNANATPLERKLADRLATAHIEISALQGEIQACGPSSHDHTLPL